MFSQESIQEYWASLNSLTELLENRYEFTGTEKMLLNTQRTAEVPSKLTLSHENIFFTRFYSTASSVMTLHCLK